MKTLVIVDVQRDFSDPSGSLYVQGGELLPARIAAIAPAYDAIVFTLDWHPADHCSFKDQGGIWPPHCVAYTEGAGLAAEFIPILSSDPSKVHLYFKGRDKEAEEYGAFDSLRDGDPAKAAILDLLEKSDGIDVCGIAGDYCVKESTARLLDYVPAEKITMIQDCIVSIDDGAALRCFIQENRLGTK